MEIEEALVKLLKNDATVANIVVDRIIPMVLDSNVVYPAVLYKRIRGGDHFERLDGPLGFRHSRFAFYSVHSKGRTSYLTVLQLGEAVRLALHGFRGTVAPDTSPGDTIRIGNILCRAAEDGYDDKTQTYQRLQIYDVFSAEPIS